MKVFLLGVLFLAVAMTATADSRTQLDELIARTDSQALGKLCLNPGFWPGGRGIAKKISLLIIHLLSNKIPPIKLAIGISACVDVAETFSSDRKEGILGVLIACLNPAATACDPAPTTVATVSDLRNIGFLLRFGT